MRTKTLLLVAAVGAAGVATSMAQVYSVNAVGYVNRDLLVGFSMIANPLNNGDNKLGTIIPTAPIGAIVYKYNGTSFDSSTFIGTWEPNLVLAPGEGAFINLPEATKLTFVGEVPQAPTGTPPLSNTVPAGFSIRSSQVPQSGNLDSDLKFPADIGDIVYFFRNGAYEAKTFIGTGFDTPAIPEVGESFFVNKTTAANWTRTFSVNP